MMWGWRSFLSLSPAQSLGVLEKGARFCAYFLYPLRNALVAEANAESGDLKILRTARQCWV
jgi:hypothetical protein